MEQDHKGDLRLKNPIYRFTFSVAVVISDLQIRYVAFCVMVQSKKETVIMRQPLFSL